MRVYIVKCPHCGKYRKTSSIKRINCFYCKKPIDVLPHLVSKERYLSDIKKKRVGFDSADSMPL